MLHLRLDTLEIIYGAKCNLRCKLCYVNHAESHIDPDNNTILAFLDRYYAKQPLTSIEFCGWGEAFTNPQFIPVLNAIHQRFPSLQMHIQTNGTILQGLETLTCWEVLSFGVSVDGLEASHDANRGAGMFQQTMRFLDAIKSKCASITIRSLLTQHNRDDFPRFFEEMRSRLAPIVPIFRMCIPDAIIANTTKPSTQYLSHDEVLAFYKVHTQYLGSQCDEMACTEIYPTIANGQIYTCCELYYAIATIDDSVDDIIAKMYHAAKTRCGQCRAYVSSHLS